MVDFRHGKDHYPIKLLDQPALVHIALILAFAIPLTLFYKRDYSSHVSVIDPLSPEERCALRDKSALAASSRISERSKRKVTELKTGEISKDKKKKKQGEKKHTKSSVPRRPIDVRAAKPLSRKERRNLRDQIALAALSRFSGKSQNGSAVTDDDNDVEQVDENPTKAKKDQGEQKKKSGVRKATLADQAKWKEERYSQDQLGFNIYGHSPTVSSESARAAADVNKPSTPALPTGFGCIQAVSHIPHLPGSEDVLKNLQRLSREFEPVVRARGWTVRALTEMCCCGDGDDFLMGGPKTSIKKGPDVYGYCVGNNNGRTALGIHIRVRRPGSCHGFNLLSYDELVSTMAHELAHICIAPHNDEFFALMAKIEEERIQCMADGLVLKEDGFAVLLDPWTRLGSGSSRKTEVIGSKELKQRVAHAALKRRGRQPKKTIPPKINHNKNSSVFEKKNDHCDNSENCNETKEKPEGAWL
mmetsp:Transcript_36601/g.53765  ORF Transcript_36601/g.53765 Transcript_36601/m.53765 type:complete len:473 (+) Transcript_36601:120-1538(+)|eukprot:CAMPEP_0195522408 /NCGR_PEP_ID=MMETSP0794_2-20130614/20568_1 /TAXON_ID=515487 /ORGANISM="Stephanopyxis turris, Strain CCMP 815" /LENGTH=472 /DNA_ID=CAMNT_0040652163 /DNA_START=119 /DNA_END=1537 /DNA_ORIENTATION=-